MLKHISYIFIVTLFLFAACAQTTKTQKGAAIGAVTGGAAGALLDHHKSLRGGLIGAAVGALTGAYVGKLEEREEMHRREESALREELYRSESEAKLREREAFVSSFKSVIFFDYNSSRLTEEGRREIRRAAAILKRYPDLNIIVKGYADPTGSENYNLTLSRNRAEVVRNALIEEGISPSRIYVYGYGETRYTRSPYGRQLSRRVEITVEEPR